jgi:ATP adenylyltransferase
MKQLWAPWRMQYVLSASDGGRRGGGAKPCIFCAMPDAPDAFRENLVLVVQEAAFVCLNKYPFAASHLLVSPRRHVASLEELSEEENAALAALVRQCTIRLRVALQPNGMNVGYNLGHAAGAGIKDHVHCHVVPRWEGDTNFMPVIGDVRVMPEYLDESWRRLHPHFADLPGVRAPAP